MTSVTDIAYVEFGFKDLERAEAFYSDFGLVLEERTDSTLLMRAACEQRYCFIGRKSDSNGLQAVGMKAVSMKVLEEAAQFPEASGIEAMDAPGGGWRVRLASPSGLSFDLTFGIEAQVPLPTRAPLKINHGQVKSRFGEWQRAKDGAAEVLRLGHVALATTDFERDFAWLQSRLGMRPSDILFDGKPENRIGAFLHCTGASRWVDHHSIALFASSETRMHHCSFELQDIDAEFLGNKWMQSRGWTGLWGIGRHVLGSQIYDYWFDPEGNLVEHFTDGDLVQPGTEAGMHQVCDDSLSQWGPPVPKTFLEPWKHEA
ncbi:VOC family protein [Variovorax sp. WS11]|uniref:VOC family protein n=1 Tax=Variovorax sp. WS11 TaxID=1105204 RepID=UPI0015E631F9|nr:VOC family protein [Variovorax sp. WS11]